MEREGHRVPIATVDSLNQGSKEARQNAEKRRLEGLNRIKVFNNPMNEPGSLLPLSRFPEVVWEAILHKLKDPQDLQNAWNTTPVFQKILKKRRLRDILMPLVMSVKHFQCMLFLDDDVEIEEEGGELYEDKDEETRDASSLGRLLPLRLVCRSWRDSVDFLFQRNIEVDKVRGNKLTVPTAYFTWPDPKDDDVLSYYDNDEDEYKKRPSVFRIQKYFTDISDFSFGVGTGQENANPPHRLLFKSLGVTMKYEEPYYYDEGSSSPNLQTFMTSISNMLEVIGDQLLHLHLDLGQVYGNDEDDVSTLMIYKAIVQWLANTPNLVYLHLHLDQWGNSRREIEDEADIQEVFAEHPFPTLKKLKTLKISCSEHSSAPTQCFLVALESNRHVKEVAVDFHTRFPAPHPEELVELLGVIQKLDLITHVYPTRSTDHIHRNLFGGHNQLPVVT